MEISAAPIEKFKTLRFPEVDVIIGTQVPLDEQEKLVETFKNGFPSEYVRYKYSDTYVDSLDGPHLFVKKRVLGESDIRHFRETGKYGIYTSGDINAAVSLLNEMRRADEVENILTLPEAQEFAHSLGYEDVTVIKPLLGIIHRQTGTKYMVYPFISGEPLVRLHPEIYFGDKQIVSKLVTLFQTHGIQPTDLAPKQFMVNDKHLYLLDLEIYNRISPAPKPIG